MSFTPTDEQLAVIEAAKTTKDNLLISALAGAAKTSTLELVCKAMSSTMTLSLAFNKKIADEMTRRLPGNVQCMTLNSIGHRTWGAATGKRLFLDTDKTGQLLKQRIEELGPDDKSEAYDMFGDLARTIRWAKSHGYVPDSAFTQFRRPTRSEEFYASLEEILPEWAERMIDRVLVDSIEMSYAGKIDFDDQIYMPTIFGGSFPQFPLVMVDEAQDLSPLNHMMLHKIARKRLIAVGDPNQSIYGFRGAVSNGMAALREDFNMRELPLSISFRCPRAVVRLAQGRAPHMRWPEWAVEGSVEYMQEWSATDVPDGAAIICRNNAPLFRTALSLIQDRRGVKLVGSDLGPQLIKTLKKLGDGNLTRDGVHMEINKWEAEKLKKARKGGGEAAVMDKANCLRVFADFGDTLAAAIAYAEALFASSGPIQLMTGHKSKGLEFPTVFFLDSFLVGARTEPGTEKAEQEDNLRYVIQTRAKERLVHISSDHFVPGVRRKVA